MREAVLVFGADSALTASLRRALLPLKVMVRPVPREEYGQPLGLLAGDKTCPTAEESYTGEELAQPMLLLAGFTGDRLDRVLAAMSRAGLRLPYKAVLTASNRLWDVPALYRELVREHEAMAAWRKEKTEGPPKGEN